jgi:hypothetical protein
LYADDSPAEEESFFLLAGRKTALCGKKTRILSHFCGRIGVAAREAVLVRGGGQGVAQKLPAVYNHGNWRLIAWMNNGRAGGMVLPG